MSKHKSDDGPRKFVAPLFGARPDPAYEPAEDGNPETEMRKFAYRLFNRDND